MPQENPALSGNKNKEPEFFQRRSQYRTHRMEEIHRSIQE